MTKQIFHWRAKRAVLMLVAIVLMIPIGVLMAQEEARNYSPPASGIWTAGAEHGAYLVMPKPVGKGMGFQILFRHSLKDSLVTGKAYLGTPICVTTYQKRLLVFLDNGGCHSYQIDSAVRTEPRLPPGLLAVSADTGGDKVYVLAHVEQSTEIEREPSRTQITSGKEMNSSPGEPNLSLEEKDKSIEQKKTTPTQSDIDEKNLSKIPPSTLAVDPGDYIIMVRGKDNLWRCASEEVLPITDWIHPTFAVHGESIYLFGIDTSAIRETLSRRTLMHCRLENGKTTTPQSLQVDNAIAVTAMEMNRQLRVIVAVSDDEIASPNPMALSQTTSLYRVGWPTEKDWSFTEPLLRKPQETLSVAPEHLAFAVMEQNLAAFELTGEEQIVFGMYDSSGNIVQNLTRKLSTAEEILLWQQAIIGFFSPMMALLLTATALLLVFHHRREFLSDLPGLPEYVQFASLGRRIAAACIDLIPAWVAAYSVVPIDRNQTINLMISMQQEPQNLIHNPEVIKLFVFLGALYLFWVGYLTLSEILLSATPGKMVMQLIVLSENLTPLTPKEALIRNLLRLMEFHVVMPFPGFFLVLLSRRRQRLGDIMARSIVVTKTPELQNQLIKMLQNKYFRRPSSDDSDSQDNSQEDSRDKNDE